MNDERQTKWMPATEAQDLGVVLEVNRQLLHPRGLALAVAKTTEPVHSVTLRDEDVETIRALIHAAPDAIALARLDALRARLDEGERYDAGEKWLSGIVDHRDDPEGVYFGDFDGGDIEKAGRFYRLLQEREAERERRLGFVVEPLSA
jgi:hypothetical protein